MLTWNPLLIAIKKKMEVLIWVDIRDMGGIERLEVIEKRTWTQAVCLL